MATVAAFVLPSGARAVPNSQPATCSGIADVGGGEAVCTRTFTLTESRFPSDLQTHGNFHATTATGRVTLEWYDQLLQLHARFICDAPGLYVRADTPFGISPQAGPADASTIPNCRREVHNSAYFAAGAQTLVVRATVRQCTEGARVVSSCPFHGYLVMNSAIVPI
jgi:hypothetical protein